MSMRTRLILVLLISLAAYTVTLADVAYGVQALAALILCGLLPGALLVDLAVGRSAAPPTRAERIVLSVGMGYAALVLGMVAVELSAFDRRRPGRSTPGMGCWRLRCWR